MQSDLKKAIARREAGESQQARALFEALFKASPDDALVNYHFAWLLDTLGEEAAAIPYYETAIANGLPDDDLRGALLGLGSTYRTLGRYDEAVRTLRRGIEIFPQANEFLVFLAMALYNVGQPEEAVSTLLKVLVETSRDESITQFKRAILLYAEDLDRLRK